MPASPPEASEKPLVERLSPALFWDVDRDAIDETAHSGFIVQRVVERGTLDDWKNLRTAMGLPVVVAAAQKLRSLDPKALAFLCAVGHVSEDSFRCSTSKPFSPKHWI